MLTHGLWQRSFGEDPDIVGQTITLDGSDFEIIGVLTPDLLLDNEVMPTPEAVGQVDIVLSFPVSGTLLADRLTEWYNIVGKLEQGVTLAQAQAALDLVAATIQELHESDPNSGFFIRAVPLIDEVVGSIRPALLVLLASVGGVLLIACLNVANLLLARATSRRRELGVRAALGAKRGRLVQELLTESALLAAIGGVLGVGFAAAALAAIHQLGAASLPRVEEIAIDGRVLLFSVTVTAVTCLVFGLLPAWRTSRINLAGTMNFSGRGTSSRGSLWSRSNLSSALVVAEIGLSLVLLIGGGLLARSFIELQRVDPGFETNGRLTFGVAVSGVEYSEAPARLEFYDQLAERIRALPGVAAVGATTDLPLTGSVNWAPIGVVDYVPPQGQGHQVISEYRVVLPGYFDAMSIPLIRGRRFDDRDVSDGTRVAIIDEHFADTYFPERDPIGMQVAAWGGPMTIVGVVGTIKYDALDTDSHVTTYQPVSQLTRWALSVVVETAGDPNTLVQPVRRIVRELDEGVAVVDVISMDGILANSLNQRRFSMVLIHVLSIVALILAGIGIYGLVSYRVKQGTRELGIRVALGASTRGILSLVLRHGLALSLVGIVTGLAAALSLAGFMRSMLFGVSAIDGLTFTAVSAGLVATTLLACYIPARRATLIDPLEAIRSD